MENEQFIQEELDKKIAAVPAFFHNPENIRQDRIAICNACDKKKKFLIFDQCSLCNCLVAFKVTFKGASCPLNKWVPAPRPTKQEYIDSGVEKS